MSYFPQIPESRLVNSLWLEMPPFPLLISCKYIKRIGPSAYLLSYYCGVLKILNNMTKIWLNYHSDIWMEFWQAHSCGQKGMFSLDGNTWVTHYREPYHIYHWICPIKAFVPWDAQPNCGCLCQGSQEMLTKHTGLCCCTEENWW